jgi:hypothetical protein
MEPTAEEFYQKMFDDIHAACCSNRTTNEMANFLADLAVRVTKLERHEA